MVAKKKKKKLLTATVTVGKNPAGKYIEAANRPIRGIQPKQHDYNIEVNAGPHRVTAVWVRFGNKVRKNQWEWDTRTMAIGSVKINPGVVKTVAKIDADQIPAKAKFCQLLCEVPNAHGHPEILITEATPLP